MKNIPNVFCIRSPIASRPYYVMPSTDGKNKLSWVKESGYHLCEPIDMQPFMPKFEECDENRASPHSFIYTSKSRKVQNISLTSNNNIINEMPILELITPISPTLLCTPYFPFDLVLHDSTEDVAFALYQRMQSKEKKLKRVTEDLQALIKKDKKIKRTTDDFLITSPKDKKPKRNTDDIFASTKIPSNLDLAPSAVPGAASLIKFIKKFIQSENGDDYQYPNNIINLISKSEELLVECIYHLISLTNNTKPTMSVTQSWKLMMLIVGYFPITEPHSEYLRDYFISAAGHEEVDIDIQYYAKICLCRLFAENRLNIKLDPEDQNFKYIKASMSMTQLFGVTLGEIFVKEEYRRIRSPEYDSESFSQIKKNVNQENTNRDDEEYFYDNLNQIPESSLFGIKKKNEEKPILVPMILKKIIKALVSLNAFEVEGILRISGEKAIEDQTVEDINNGNWEEPSIRVHTIISTMKRFIRELQDPLFPNYLLEIDTEKTLPYQIIQLINQLPAPQKETLMFLMGFFQQIADRSEVNKMNTQNIIISLGTMFIRSEATSMENFKSRQSKNDAILRALLNHWNTSPIYDI